MARDVRELRFATTTALVDSLTADLAAALNDVLAARPVAGLVVPGGRTPVPLFRRLSREPLPWQRVTITLGDERWVEPTDAASNERLVRTELLQQHARAATFVGLKNAAATPQAGAAESWRRLEAVPRPFAAVVLGMGDDGHFASLFPHSAGIDAALDPESTPACVATTAPAPPEPRLSLNLAALLQTHRVALLITGETKWRIYEQARTAASRDLPVRALLDQRLAPVTVYWTPDATEG